MVPAGGDVDGAAVCVGCTVELHGLTKASLNGARGVIVSYDAERARFGVSGVGDGVIAVKPENLQRVNEPPADEAEEAAAYTEPDGDELLECARYGELAELGQLLDLGTDPDFRDAGRSTALHRACANGHVAIIERLASAGAGHVANAEGNTPLHWAVQQGQADAVHTLLRLYPSIDVLAQNSFGRSASTEAFAKDDTRIVEALLSHSSAAALEKDGADLGADEYADSPAYHAEEIHAFAFGPPADAVGGASPPNPPVCVRELGSLEADGTDAILGTTATLDRTGLQLWAAAVVMGRWLTDLSPVLARRSVLELGAGCGLCGIVAARVCGAASVLLTDLAEHTLDNLRHNVEINPGGGATVAALDWEKPDSWPAEPFEARAPARRAIPAPDQVAPDLVAPDLGTISAGDHRLGPDLRRDRRPPARRHNPPSARVWRRFPLRGTRDQPAG